MSELLTKPRMLSRYMGQVWDEEYPLTDGPLMDSPDVSSAVRVLQTYEYRIGLTVPKAANRRSRQLVSQFVKRVAGLNVGVVAFPADVEHFYFPLGSGGRRKVVTWQYAVEQDRADACRALLRNDVFAAADEYLAEIPWFRGLEEQSTP